jgi:D-glycero-D-manno-heptose 1,7-bisphosphate phosphatase
MENSKLIILDRDGVINQDSDDFIKSPEEWQAIPGSLEAIARLCREDYRVVIITNQSGISRGLYTINTLNKIHEKMIEDLHRSGGEISAVFFCPHSDDEDCECRKPKPGMFLELAKRLKCNLKDVYAVGDSLRDIQATVAAGAMPILVETGKGLKTIEEMSDPEYGLVINSTPVFKDLSSFVDDLLWNP